MRIDNVDLIIKAMHFLVVSNRLVKIAMLPHNREVFLGYIICFLTFTYKCVKNVYDFVGLLEPPSKYSFIKRLILITLMVPVNKL